MPTWPSTIPQAPLYGAFSEQRQRNVASFAPEIGPPKMRRRATASAVATSATFVFTDAELAIFNTFYETTLSDGSLPFDWDHPLTGTTYSWMFAADEAPQIDRTDNDFNTMSCKLLRLP